MTLAKIQKTIFKVDSNTLPAAGHTYSIQVSGGGSAIPIYSNSSGTVPLDNPGTLPSNGLLSFFIRSGTCRIKVTDPITLEEQIWDSVPCISPDVLSSANATLQFATFTDLVNGNPINKGETIDFADYVGQKVTTVANNTTSKKGGAPYIIKTAAQVAADGDVIDGDRNVWLVGGTDYAAILLLENFQDFNVFGYSGSDYTQTALNALNNTSTCAVPEGEFDIDGLSFGLDGRTILGAGLRSTRLNITTAPSTYGIDLSGDYNCIRDLRIQGTGGTTNLLSFSGNSYYNHINNVWFGPAAIGVKNVDTSDFFYSGFAFSHWRDCATGVQATSQDDFNGTYFIGCSFNYPNSALVGPGLDLAKSDGILYAGCTTQNQTIKIDDVQGFEICGGYHETGNSQTNPILESKNSIFNISGGAHFPPGAYFKIDSYAGKFAKGNMPNMFSKETEGITRQDNDSQFLAPTQESVDNLFPDTSCSTTAAVSNIQFSSTSILPASATINGSGHVELGFTATNQRGGFEIPGVSNISFFMKWRALTGTVRVGLGNTTVTQNTDHDSTSDSEWRYTWLHGRTSSGSPFVNIQPITATSSIEIDQFSCVANYCFVRENGSKYKWPKGTNTFASAATSVVTFTRVPGGADYQISLCGNVNETFWVTSKTRTGFTINSSNATSTASVDWSIVQR